MNHVRLPVGIGKRSKDVIGALRDRKARHFVEGIATRTVPSYDLAIDLDRVRKSLIALIVVPVDLLPGRQDEYQRMKPVHGKHGAELVRRQWLDLVNHGDRVDDATIEEHPVGLVGVTTILVDVTVQHLSSERERVGSRAL